MKGATKFIVGIIKSKNSNRNVGVFSVWVPMRIGATQGFYTGNQIKKTKAVAFVFVVWGGIEPPTQGFSVLCSTD
jgi:hypothetical protein